MIIRKASSKNLVEIKMYETMLPAVLYGCKTCSVILKEEHRLRVLQSRLLRRLFRSKRQKETEGWRIMHDQKRHNLYPANISRMMKSRRMSWAGHVAHVRTCEMDTELWSQS